MAAENGALLVNSVALRCGTALFQVSSSTTVAAKMAAIRQPVTRGYLYVGRGVFVAAAKPGVFMEGSYCGEMKSATVRFILQSAMTF